MAASDLRRLWDLHEIDAEIYDIKRRAANFNPGKEFAARLKQLEALEAEVGGRHKALHAEKTDLELQIKSLQDKAKRIDKDIYGGSVTSSREVEALEKDLAQTKRQLDDRELRLLEVTELLEPAQAELDKILKEKSGRAQQLKQAQAQGLQEREAMQKRYAELTKLRPEKAKIVSAPMLARYEGIRGKHSTGMAKIKGVNCEGCGTVQSEKVILTAKDERLITCESCHRILYHTEGLL